MKRNTCILILFALLTHSVTAMASGDEGVAGLTCEGSVNPQGIDVTLPRLGWQINSQARDVRQLAYQVIVASSEARLASEQGDLWNSGKVISGNSQWVAYRGRPLNSRQECFWKVKIWTSKGEQLWSAPARFSMGLLHPSDWKAHWIGLDKAFPWDSVSKFARLSARYFRKEINTPKAIRKATVYLSGLGLYELYINGEKIGDQVLAPSPTDYSKTVLYNTFDVTRQLRKGKNAIAAVLGNGRFFTMRQHYKPKKWHTFGFPKILLQLEIELSDGSRQYVTSDGSWKITADGPVRTNNEYDGEEYDATRELTGWEYAGYDDRKWQKVELVRAPGGMMKAQMNPNMKVMERLRPVAIHRLSTGQYIVDMGQNMAGWIRLRVQGKRGDVVKLRFAESLQPDGSLYTANLRDALVTDKYTLKGEGVESWHPLFVFHGFRFVEVTGYPGQPAAEDFTGEVVYDDLATTGSLETSSPLLNQIHKNAYWGIRSNYKGMPIDCPQRNERQPWLGDRTMGAYGESFLFDNSRLYAKWLNDIQDAQRPDGSIPDVAPSFWYYYKDNMTWPGAYLTIADMLSRQFGDRRPVIAHYASMKKWMSYMKGKYLRGDFIMTKDSYGDWCVPPESPQLIHSRDSSRITDPQLIATAYYYYFLHLLQKFATWSGHSSDIEGFSQEALKVKTAFNRRFYDPSTARYGNNTVTANILALAFHLVPEGDSDRVFRNIAEKIMVDNQGHISTGVIGTQWLMRWLTTYNRPDIAFRLASNTTYPSWGYMVENGATTIWELWNGNTADPKMNSQNHVMLLGDLLIWIYEDLAGIKSDETESGFRKVIMKPSFSVGLDFVRASHQTPYGRVESNWEKEGEALTWNITIPANVTAEVYFPAGQTQEIREGNQAAISLDGVHFLRREEGRTVLEIGSGHYSFRVGPAPEKKNTQMRP